MNLSDQRCLHHPAREAVAQCPECRQVFCRECVTEHDDRVLCASCLRRLSRRTGGRRWRSVGALRVFQGLAGVMMAWLFFYWVGQALLAIPSSFHDGTVWQAGARE